jgi:hypothetical protein
MITLASRTGIGEMSPPSKGSDFKGIQRKPAAWIALKVVKGTLGIVDDPQWTLVASIQE